MKCVIQRVRTASVSIGDELVSQIGNGMLVLAAVEKGDTEQTMRMFDPEWQRPTDGHLTGGAFRCKSPEEVDRVFAELLEAGATPYKEPWDAFWGQRYAQLKDPDGTVLDLYCPTES